MFKKITKLREMTCVYRLSPLSTSMNLSKVVYCFFRLKLVVLF